MIKKITLKLAVIILLLTTINSCYYERETDQLKVCFLRSNNIWTMDIDGSQQKQITFSGLDYAPSWSPDGNKIAFYSDRINPSQIFIINNDGSGLKQITYTTGVDVNRYPTWFPDGNKILFTGQRSGSIFIFITNLDGEIEKQTASVLSPLQGSISPDSNYIIFNVAFGYLSRLNINTGIFENVTSNPFNSGNSWSSDGSQIAFSNGTSISVGNPYAYDTFTNIYSSSSNYPCWTPDGKNIIFSSSSIGICSIKADGSDLKILTNISSDNSPCVQGKPR